MTTYTLRLSREDHWWIVTVPELDSVTQGRDLPDALHMGFDLIETVTDQAPQPDDITVEVPYEVLRRLHPLDLVHPQGRKLRGGLADLAKLL